jgi:hypothetical protein
MMFSMDRIVVRKEISRSSGANPLCAHVRDQGQTCNYKLKGYGSNIEFAVICLSLAESLFGSADSFPGS